MKNPLKKFFGPSTLVAAAFIGPGTITVCTLAGVRSGYTLLWALLFSVFATIILQEMTGRLGIATRKGLGEAIRKNLTQPVIRIAGILVVVSAIVIGNIAYEGGNISGAVLGWEEFFVGLDFTFYDLRISLTSVIIGVFAFIVLYLGSIKKIVIIMTSLVALMSVVFVTTAIFIQPSMSAILKGLFIPVASADELFTVVALIGTTVVPYNLFLHASTVQERYKHVSEMNNMRIENAVGIILGGLISVCVVITSAAAADGGLGEVQNASDMAKQLQPLLGDWARVFMGVGLFAAGITSAITAPLAAAFATKGIFGWKGGIQDLRFRAVWVIVLLVGVMFSSLSINPVQLIEFAQVANGITLPVIAIFLLYIMNKPLMLGTNRNSRLQNILGIFVILVTLLIGFRSLNSVLNII
ncbi:MAG: Nramp family divalent metal transporter [Gracilimonas sp.]|nr:Nramp family divalent metal transporter [Gracilimonas sp.]